MHKYYNHDLYVLWIFKHKNSFRKALLLNFTHVLKIKSIFKYEYYKKKKEHRWFLLSSTRVTLSITVDVEYINIKSYNLFNIFYRMYVNSNAFPW